MLVVLIILKIADIPKIGMNHPCFTESELRPPLGLVLAIPCQIGGKILFQVLFCFNHDKRIFSLMKANALFDCS